MKKLVYTNLTATEAVDLLIVAAALPLVVSEAEQNDNGTFDVRFEFYSVTQRLAYQSSASLFGHVGKAFA